MYYIYCIYYISDGVQKLYIRGTLGVIPQSSYV